MKSDNIQFPEKLLEENYENVVEQWPDPNVGTYSEQSAWLCLDIVSSFSYILEQIGFFKTLEDALYYIQNPGKFCNEYKAFYEACDAYDDKVNQ